MKEIEGVVVFPHIRQITKYRVSRWWEKKDYVYIYETDSAYIESVTPESCYIIVQLLKKYYGCVAVGNMIKVGGKYCQRLHFRDFQKVLRGIKRLTLSVRLDGALRLGARQFLPIKDDLEWILRYSNKKGYELRGGVEAWLLHAYLIQMGMLLERYGIPYTTDGLDKLKVIEGVLNRAPYLSGGVGTKRILILRGIIERQGEGGEANLTDTDGYYLVKDTGEALFLVGMTRFNYKRDKARGCI